MVEETTEKTEKIEKIILPGEFVDEKKGRKLGRGVYAEGEKIFSQVIGLPRSGIYEVSVIPLAGKYMPQIGDRVIGVISEVQTSGWLVSINSPYIAYLPMSEGVEEFVDPSRTDLSRYYKIDDIIFCKVSRVTQNKSIQVSMRDMMARKLYGGVILEITPSKIPRLIGKAGSMINLIKQKTKCDIYTGQNGVVWVRGENKAKAIEAISTVEKESHTSGLTDKIEKMLGE